MAAGEALHFPVVPSSVKDSTARRVQEVPDACAEDSPQYFFTLTCSMTKQRRMRPSFEAINEVHGNGSSDVYEAVVQRSIGLFARMWERVWSLVIDYIEIR